MKKIITNCLLCALIIVTVISCHFFETDTYSTPNATLKGTLTDPSGDPLITQEPNGFKIRLIEKGSTKNRDFWGKPNGSFLNSKIFSGTYKIIPTQGAFFPADTVMKKISGVTTVTFVVIPYLKISASITRNDSTLKAIYTIKKAQGAGKIQNSRLLVSKWNPNIGINYFSKSTTRDLSNIPDNVIGNTTYTDKITNYLESGVTYYARVAVLSANNIGRYNFSKIKKIVVP